MGIKTELETVFICDKCGHEWTSKTFTRKEPPIACAACKNPYWNRGKRK